MHYSALHTYYLQPASDAVALICQHRNANMRCVVCLVPTCLMLRLDLGVDLPTAVHPGTAVLVRNLS